METQQLNVKTRSLKRSSGVKKLRAQGHIPGVLYGYQVDPVNLDINVRAFDTLIRTSESDVIIADLNIEGDDRPRRKALLKNVQYHVLRGDVLHVDFMEVNEERPVTITVPIEPFGEAHGVKNGGGTLGIILNRIKIKALPKDIPAVIRPNISHLGVGEIFFVKDLPKFDGVEYLMPDDIQIMTIIPPRVTKKTVVEEKGKKKGK
jgi:large subunit ribosomal protein L25